MSNDRIPKPMSPLWQSRFFFLLVCLIVYMAIVPLLEGFSRIRFLTDIVFSALLLSTIYAVSEQRRDWMVAAVLALPMLLSVWMRHVTPIPEIALAGHIFDVLFFSFTAVLILKFVFKENQVNLDVISAAIVVYMFLGFLWSGVYEILEFLAPGSFSISQALLDNAGPGRLSYFSFVTLTTLGYGDISPVSGPARHLAILEAFIGQLYLAVLIARLVGSYISSPDKR